MFRKKEEFSRGDPESYKKYYALKALALIVPLCIATVGLFITTQKFAAFMNYDPNVVGQPLHVFSSGYRLYNPLVFLPGIFKFAFNNTYSAYFFQASPPAVFSLILAAFVYAISMMLLGSHQRNQHIHGTARWGTVKDLKELGHLQQYGVVCGELDKAAVYSKINPKKGNLVLHIKKNLITRKEKIAPLVCHSGATNTWMVAPTRAAKGVSVVIPTCLNYGVPHYKSRVDRTIEGRGSIVVFDPKGENYAATAGWRSKFSTVLKFAPLDGTLDKDGNLAQETVHYNPICEIPDDPATAFAWADMIGENFFSAEKASGGGGDQASEYFNSRARDMFTGAVLHVRFSPDVEWKDKNLTTVLQKFSQDNGDEEGGDDEDSAASDAFLNEMMTTSHGSETIDRLVKEAAIRTKKMNVKERGSMFSTIFSKLTLFQDPLVAAATSYSDFSIDDFVNGKNGISLYLIVPYNHITRIAPVFRMLVNFMIKKFSDGTTNANEVKLKIPCLFLLDEFPVLGYFPEIAKNMGILAGYGVTFFIVSQSFNQIVDVYGENHPFMDHCKTKIIYASGNYKDASNIAQSIGNRSVLLDNISSSMTGFRGASLSSSEQSVSLINADELMKLEFSRMIVLLEGKPPYKGKKVVYYEDPRFKNKQFMEIPKFEQLMKVVRTLPSNRVKRAAPKKTAREIVEGIDVMKEIPSSYDVFNV